MFTLSVSWLLVGCIPGLLMLATLGLGRLERALTGETVAATETVHDCEQAEPVDVRTLAREGMPDAVEYLHRRHGRQRVDSPPPTSYVDAAHTEPFFATHLTNHYTAELPTRAYGPAWANRQLTTTRRANRV